MLSYERESTARHSSKPAVGQEARFLSPSQHYYCRRSRQNRSIRHQPQQQQPTITAPRQPEYQKKKYLYNNKLVALIMDVDDNKSDNDEMMTSIACVDEEEKETSENSHLSPLPTTAKAGTASESATKKDRRAVMFKRKQSIEEVRRISRISSRSLAEVVAYWGTTDEHMLRKQELRKAATEMQAKRRMSDNMEFTSLGLADKVGEGKMLKKQNRYLSREAVLDEQDLQYQEGIVDDELLADVYSSVTYGPQKDAAQKAAMLHEEVKKF